jgi:hypothetical protein
VADTNCLLGWLLKYGRYKLPNGLATKMRVLNCLMGWQLKCDSYKLFYGLATKMICQPIKQFVTITF